MHIAARIKLRANHRRVSGAIKNTHGHGCARANQTATDRAIIKFAVHIRVGIYIDVGIRSDIRFANKGFGARTIFHTATNACATKVATDTQAYNGGGN